MGSGPITTNPWDVRVVTKWVEPMSTTSSPLKFAFLIINVAAPVAIVMVAPLSVARLAPPKLPLPASVSAIVAVPPPLFTLGTMARILTHLMLPLGHLPSTIKLCRVGRRSRTPMPPIPGRMGQWYAHCQRLIRAGNTGCRTTTIERLLNSQRGVNHSPAGSY